jgi:hypothetical protein
VSSCQSLVSRPCSLRTSKWLATAPPIATKIAATKKFSACLEQCSCGEAYYTFCKDLEQLLAPQWDRRHVLGRRIVEMPEPRCLGLDILKTIPSLRGIGRIRLAQPDVQGVSLVLYSKWMSARKPSVWRVLRTRVLSCNCRAACRDGAASTARSHQGEIGSRVVTSRLVREARDRRCQGLDG